MNEVMHALATAIAQREEDAILGKPADVVSLQDYEDAIWELCEARKRAGIIGDKWLVAAMASLHVKVDNYFRDSRVPRDQQQFMAMMKKMALGYQEDAQALHWAAARLKNTHHDIHGASETHKAALVAARAAQELIGED